MLLYPYLYLTCLPTSTSTSKFAPYNGLTHYTTMVSENSVLCVFSLGPPTTDSDLNAPPPHRQSVIFE